MEQKNEYKEWDWGVELDAYDQEAEKYWQEFDKENFDWDKIQNANKEHFSNMLKGELGKDIMNVTTGKKVIKLPFKMKIKYWFKRIFEIFS